MKFKITNDDREIECEIVLTFRDDSNNRNYIVYTDGTKDSNGELKLYSSRYIVDKGNFILGEIENDYEWNLIDNMLLSKFNEKDS